MATVTFRRNPRFEAEMGPQLAILMRSAAAFVAAYARSHHAYTDRTGRLTRSIEGDVDGTMGIVVASTPYAAFVELGTRRMSPRAFLRPALMSLRGWRGGR